MRTPRNECVSPAIADGVEARSGSGPASACPERRCILSGEHGPRAGLIRLAIAPDGTVLPDVLARAPGRGAWLGANRAALEAAMAAGKHGGKLKGALARAFKGAPLNVPEDLPQRIEDALARALLDRLGLELRAGKIVLGSDRIAEQARSGRVAQVLHAADASEDGARKLDQAWRVGQEREGSGERGIRLPLDRAALSVALGRDNVVHMALADDAAAGRIGAILARLTHFRGDAPAPNPGHDGACAAGTTN